MERHLRHSMGGSSHLAVMRTSYVEFWQLKECVYQLLCGLETVDGHSVPLGDGKNHSSPDLFIVTDHCIVGQLGHPLLLLFLLCIVLPNIHAHCTHIAR